MEQLGYLTTFDRNLAHRCGGLITVVMTLAVKRDASPRTDRAFTSYRAYRNIIHSRKKNLSRIWL